MFVKCVGGFDERDGGGGFDGEKDFGSGSRRTIYNVVPCGVGIECGEIVNPLAIVCCLAVVVC